MEVVALSGSSNNAPFKRQVHEWQHIDSKTGALLSGRLEAGRSVSGNTNHYGKVSWRFHEMGSSRKFEHFSYWLLWYSIFKVFITSYRYSRPSPGIRASSSSISHFMFELSGSLLKLLKCLAASDFAKNRAYSYLFTFPIINRSALLAIHIWYSISWLS